jgi:hypothetical protein
MTFVSDQNVVHPTLNIKAQMQQLIDHLRDEVGRVTEPQAQALLLTSAEVLTDLVSAFDDFEKRREECAWRAEINAYRLKE